MLVQALYNIVDSVFVARISEEALTAVTLVFPLQNLMIAVGSGTGVGVNALLSRSLGEKNFPQADKAANTAVLLSLFNFLLFLVISFTVVGPFVGSQTDSEIIKEYGRIYGAIVSGLSFGLFFQIMFERLLQSTGLTIYSMVSQLTGAIINMILDPIMIFGLLGFPKLGIAGAAYATVIGQSIAALTGLFFNLRKNKELHFSIRSILRPERRTLKRIYSVGVPSIAMLAIGSIMTYSMNRVLKTFSDTATAVFGAYFKLQSFFFMPVIGLNNGAIPVLAYNLGAGKKERIDETISFTSKLAIVIMIAGTLVFEIFPAQLLSLFDASEHMLSIGIPAMRIIALHFPVAAISITRGAIFQAFSRSLYSLVVSLCRQLVVLIPAAYLLSLTGIVANVWWSFLIAEAMSLALTLIFFRKVYRQTFGAEEPAPVNNN
ncbi:MAG: MATE family efflux transporter [Lachnospiraceae bacterium]|nr:MATE family efflux transporter [Lachnospiraceae bacterium]